MARFQPVRSSSAPLISGTGLEIRRLVGGVNSPFDRVGQLVFLDDARIEASGGFDEHQHRNIEILTYELFQGESLAGAGEPGSAWPGSAQAISAGTGMAHGGPDGLVKDVQNGLEPIEPDTDDTPDAGEKGQQPSASWDLQAWFRPRHQDRKPRYQLASPASLPGEQSPSGDYAWTTILGPGSPLQLDVNAAVRDYRTLAGSSDIPYTVPAGRALLLFQAGGKSEVKPDTGGRAFVLSPGDSLAVTETDEDIALTVSCSGPSHLISYESGE